MNLKIQEGELCLERDDGSLDFFGVFGECVYWEFEPKHWTQVAFFYDDRKNVSVFPPKEITKDQLKILECFIKLHA